MIRLYGILVMYKTFSKQRDFVFLNPPHVQHHPLQLNIFFNYSSEGKKRKKEKEKVKSSHNFASIKKENPCATFKLGVAAIRDGWGRPEEKLISRRSLQAMVSEKLT